MVTRHFELAVSHDVCRGDGGAGGAGPGPGPGGPGAGVGGKLQRSLGVPGGNSKESTQCMVRWCTNGNSVRSLSAFLVRVSMAAHISGCDLNTEEVTCARAA